MKRLLVGVLLAGLLTGAVGVAVLAAENPATVPVAGWAWQNLTDKQKADLTELRNQMFAVREKMIDRYVEYKWITPEQAQLQKDRLALQKKYAAQYGFGPGAGCGFQGGFGGRRGWGAGVRGGFGPGYGMMGD